MKRESRESRTARLKRHIEDSDAYAVALVSRHVDAINALRAARAELETLSGLDWTPEVQERYERLKIVIRDQNWKQYAAH